VENPLVQIAGMIEPLPHDDLTAMQSLVDIEQAVQNLSAEQQAELLLFVAERLRSKRVPLPEPREFTQEQLKAWLDEDEQAMERFWAGS
jgi:polyphosphate kinase